MKEFDDIWNDIYRRGHINRYPWDMVVSFIFRHRPKLDRSSTNILELGCGAGNNLAFAAAEGFSITGVDASKIAIDYAEERFRSDDLIGQFYCCDFQEIPISSCSQHLVFDRAALTCTPRKVIENTISEVHRILVPGGKFLFVPYADSHSSFVAGDYTADGVVNNITEGSLVDVGQITFASISDIHEWFKEGWKLCSIQRVEATEMATAKREIHAEYRVVAEKIG